MILFFQFIYMVDYIDRFLYVEPSLHFWDEVDLVMIDNFLMCSWIQFASIFCIYVYSEIGL